MYLGFWNFYNAYNGNRMFTQSGSTTTGDDIAYGTVYLAERLRALGHRVATLDMDKLENFDAAFFFDHPTALNKYYQRLRRMRGKKLYVFLAENEANRPDNYWRWNLRPFHKVFTWDPTLVDNKKFFQIWHTVRVPSPFSIDTSVKTKFCMTIASQKYLSHPKNLAEERLALIRWFEKHHPDKFDLYGGRWDRVYFRGRLSRLNLLLHLFYMKFPKRFRTSRFPLHRGSVPNKNAAMRQYKFALAYENSIFPGYVTEKLFEVFFAGCVPIYWGAPDVTDNVPANTFVDRRNFRNHEELYKYLNSMSEQEYLGYVRAIEEYVRGDQIKIFGGDRLVEVFLKEIIEPHEQKALASKL